MVRYKFLLVSVAVLSSTLLFPPCSAYAAEEQCTREQILAGTCSAPAPVVTPGLGNGGVNLGGTVTVPGTGNGSGTGIRGPGAGGGPPAPPGPPACIPGPAACRDGFTVTSPLDDRGPVTLADLVNFRPVAGTSRMEPNGWTVVGLDTNFYVETGAHVQDDLLLGVPASVRFTPVAYRWTYGDGSSASRTTRGSSWQAQGSGEFDPTGTSHVYRAAGDFVVDLTVDFRAEYRFGPSAWIPIAGTVPVASDPLAVSAGDASTVLVERDCTVDRAGPGC